MNTNQKVNIEQKLSKCARVGVSIIGIWGAFSIAVYLFGGSRITYAGITGILYLMVPIVYFLHKRIEKVEENIREQEKGS